LPPGAALVLRDNGLGSAAFGADPDGVIGYVSSVLGKPTVDSGWIDPLSQGSCPGTELRTVSFGDLALSFSDESTVASGRRHFFSYSYGPAFGAAISPGGLATEAGLSVGTTVAQMKGTYPTATINPGDDTSPPTFAVSPGLTGLLTGITDTDTVSELQGGFGCGE
jgi:hypothetical protein